jgi:hypothetical protein
MDAGLACNRQGDTVFVDACDVEVCDYHWSEVTGMSISNDKRMERRPTDPGEMLREDYLPDYGPPDYGLSVSGLAEAECSWMGCGH